MEHRLKQEPARHSLRSLAAFALLALLTGLAFWNSLDNGFPLDDQALIEDNPLITKPEYLLTLLANDYWAGARDPAFARHVKSGLYRPLVLLSYSLNYAVAGPSPRSYHFVNVLLHVLITWLLYVLAMRLGFPARAALVSALLFAVHPLHTEAVASIVGRAELLMTAGVLAGLWWAIQGRSGLSLGAFLLALLSKEQAVMLPFLLLVYDLSYGNAVTGASGRTGRVTCAFRRYGPYAILLVGYVVIRAVVLGGFQLPAPPFLHNPLLYLDAITRLLTTVKVAGYYLWLFIWPQTLSVDYSYDVIPISRSLWDGWTLFGLLGWSGLLGCAAWSWRRIPQVTVAIALAVLPFVPVSNLILPIGTIMGERLFYLPSAGLCLLAGLGVHALAMRWVEKESRTAPTWWPFRVALYGTLAVLLVLFTVRTKERNRDWMNTESAMVSALRAYPSNAKAHAWIAEAAIGRQDWDLAVAHSEEALRIYPEYEMTDGVMAAVFGLALVETGHIAEGMTRIERAVALEPNWSEIRRLLGVAYATAHRYPDAKQAFRKAIDLNPGNRFAHFGLSYVDLEEGNYESALQEAETAIDLRPDFMEAHYIRARALEALGRDATAIEEYAWVMKFYRAPGDVAERFYRLQAARRGQG